MDSTWVFPLPSEPQGKPSFPLIQWKKTPVEGRFCPGVTLAMPLCLPPGEDISHQTCPEMHDLAHQVVWGWQKLSRNFSHTVGWIGSPPKTCPRPKTWAGIAVMLPYARNAKSYLKLEEASQNFSLRAFRGRTVLMTYWFQTSGLRNSKRINFCVLSHQFCAHLFQAQETKIPQICVI